MVEEYARRHTSLVAVEDVPPRATDRYGIVSVDDPEARVSTLSGIVEKPRPEQAPSTLGVVGRYVLTPGIFRHLERTPRGAGGEIQLTDAIADLLDDAPVYAYSFEGKRYDCGSKLGYLKATVAFGLAHPGTGAAFREHLRKVLDEAASP